MPERTFVAFDVDNTLLDPEMRAYRETVVRFLEATDIGLPPDEAYDTFEEARATGHALERLGLRNPIHDRGNAEGLAAFGGWAAFGGAVAAATGGDQQERRYARGEERA